MDPFDAAAAGAAYDTVADDYVAAFADDLAQLSFDRAVLDAAVKRLHRTGPVVDIGCGPAQVSRYLGTHGVRSIGLDLARRMLILAKRAANADAYVCGDIRALPVRSQSCSGAVAFYSIQHLPRAGLGAALGEVRRALTPAGILVIAAHLGAGETYSDEFLGHHIEPIGGTFYSADELNNRLREQGFVVEDQRFRDPLPHEYPSTRIYLTARCAGTLAR